MSGRKTFVGGDILLASELNGFLMDQAVMVFDDAAARTTAIPSPSEGMITYLKNTNLVDKYDGANWIPIVQPTGFTARQVITASDSSWAVPSLASPVVKVTVIGAGGGGSTATNAGSNGGTTTFNAGGAGSISAAGGLGSDTTGPLDKVGLAGGSGLRSSNAGGGGFRDFNPDRVGRDGQGGEVTVAYLNLSGVSTVNVTIGNGGPGGTDAGGGNAGDGGRGEVIVEYVAA
jgi:hypothetical protein